MLVVYINCFPANQSPLQSLYFCGLCIVVTCDFFISLAVKCGMSGMTKWMQRDLQEATVTGQRFG